MIEQHRRLAQKIISDWRRKRRSAIVITPPLSFPEANFFKVLESGDEHAEILGDAVSQVAIARMSGTDFSSERQFVERLSQQWGVAANTKNDTVAIMEELTDKVCNGGKKPIVIIRRFHVAMERLGEQFGTKLRNLEHEYGLVTVVEIPIDLESLRKEWRLRPDGSPSPFLESNWGQGHHPYLLMGYGKAELTAMLGVRDDAAELADFVFRATGGLPGLAEWLVDEADSKRLEAVRAIARANAADRCKDLLRWLDLPNQRTFGRLVARNVVERNPLDMWSCLRDHSWGKLLIDDDGRSTCLMLGWASLAGLANSQDAKLSDHLVSVFQAGDISEVVQVLNDVATFKPTRRDIWKALSLLARFQEVTNPYGHDWPKARKILDELETLSHTTNEPDVREVCGTMAPWNGIVDVMCGYIEQRRRDSGARIEEYCLCAPRSHLRELLQYLWLRLLRADAYASEPLAALRLIVELPESILQAYSESKFGFHFWSFLGREVSHDQVLDRLR